MNIKQEDDFSFLENQNKEILENLDNKINLNLDRFNSHISNDVNENLKIQYPIDAL